MQLLAVNLDKVLLDNLEAVSASNIDWRARTLLHVVQM